MSLPINCVMEGFRSRSENRLRLKSTARLPLSLILQGENQSNPSLSGRKSKRLIPMP